MKLSFLQFLFLLGFIHFSCYSQENEKEISFLFYNVENLFDTDDDQGTGDSEFLPGGTRHWTYKRLNQKLLDISKVIVSAGGWEPPAMIALSEVENRKVLEMLTMKTPLKSVPYRIIHKKSADHRGIDVAFIYHSEMFFPVEYQFFPLMDKNGKPVETREILYVSGILNGQDTLHFFINHWPSRYSGMLETKSLRNQAAQLLRKKTNELFSKHPAPKIIIAGDFNDQPRDESLVKYLKAEPIQGKTVVNSLYNLSYHWPERESGTLKYLSQWFVFDQIIVSGALLDSENGFYTNEQNAGIVHFPFLVEPDSKYGGTQPRSTYNGFIYQGGFSDHLPVLLKLRLKN